MNEIFFPSYKKCTGKTFSISWLGDYCSEVSTSAICHMVGKPMSNAWQMSVPSVAENVVLKVDSFKMFM